MKISYRASTNWLLVSSILFVAISAFIGPLGLMAALNDKVVSMFRLVEFIVLVIIIVLMVMKPF